VGTLLVAKRGWLVGAVLLGLWALGSLLGAAICLVSGNLAGFAFGLAWALGGYWFARGMFERTRPKPQVQ